MRSPSEPRTPRPMIRSVSEEARQLARRSDRPQRERDRSKARSRFVITSVGAAPALHPYKGDTTTRTVAPQAVENPRSRRSL